MHYLITGHTGFKGAWLTLMLKRQGHLVSGIALDPLPGALFETAAIQQDLEHDIRLDIRDAKGVREALQRISPDVVIHMAAQPLVRESYRNPRYTFETNVNGTLNVLEATQATPGIQAQLIVTTDKVYRNVNRIAGYVETDPLGGDDPYSASKAMADILTQSWMRSFPGVPTAIARAGNVIGGGDVSSDRLLPDLLNAYSAGREAVIRYPQAVRPWQHVLDCLNGYSMIVDALLAGLGQGAWNIGPDESSFVTVGEVASRVAVAFGPSTTWTTEVDTQPHEAGLLALDASKARTELHWCDRLAFADALQMTIDWHLAPASLARETTTRQISTFDALAET